MRRLGICVRSICTKLKYLKVSVRNYSYCLLLSVFSCQVYQVKSSGAHCLTYHWSIFTTMLFRVWRRSNIFLTLHPYVLWRCTIHQSAWRRITGTVWWMRCGRWRLWMDMSSLMKRSLKMLISPRISNHSKNNFAINLLSARRYVIVWKRVSFS